MADLLTTVERALASSILLAEDYLARQPGGLGQSTAPRRRKPGAPSRGSSGASSADARPVADIPFLLYRSPGRLSIPMKAVTGEPHRLPQQWMGVTGADAGRGRGRKSTDGAAVHGVAEPTEAAAE